MSIKYKKKGISSISTIFVLFICISMFTLISVYIIDIFIPFLWHQKLDNIANKYMFVIEKYGYLTSKEEENLKNDLIKEGFKMDKIQIIVPSKEHLYGEVLEFIVEYRTDVNNINIVENLFKLSNKEAVIRVYKNCYSKI